MKSFTKLPLLAATILVPQIFSADAFAYDTSTCISRGYTHKDGPCKGDTHTLKCPYDGDYVFCKIKPLISCNDAIKARDTHALIVGPNEDIKTLNITSYSGDDIYIKGHVIVDATMALGDFISFADMSIHDAYGIPECKTEKGDTSSLTINEHVLLKPGLNFQLPITISKAEASEGGWYSIYFGSGTKIDTFLVPNDNNITLSFGASTNGLNFQPNPLSSSGKITLEGAKSGVKIEYSCTGDVKVKCTAELGTCSTPSASCGTF